MGVIAPTWDAPDMDPISPYPGVWLTFVNVSNDRLMILCFLLLLMGTCNLLEFYGTGPMITCINDLKILLMRIVSVKDTTHEKLSGDKKLLLSLMEPTIEYIMNMIFKSSYQVSDELTFCNHTSCLVSFLQQQCISMCLYYLFHSHRVRCLPIFKMKMRICIFV